MWMAASRPQTRLHFPEVNAPSEEVEAFGRSLTPLVNRKQPEASALYTKPTNREKHTGGKLILPGSPEEALLLDWVRYLARVSPANPTSKIQRITSVPTAPVMRRLTHSSTTTQCGIFWAIRPALPISSHPKIS